MSAVITPGFGPPDTRVATAPHRPDLKARRWQSLGAAAALELAAIAGTVAWLSLRPAPLPEQVVALHMEEAAAPVPAPPPPAPPVPVKPPPPLPAPAPPKAQARPVTAPSPAPSPAPALPVTSAPSEAPVAATAPAAAPAPVPPAPPPTPAPAPAPAAPAGPPAEYVAKVRAAVQAAFVYPPAAAALDFHGRVRVAFNLRGTSPSGARVLVPSGMGLVDRAALQSVQAASYPAPPPALKEVDQSFEVWVEFKP